MTEKKSYDTNVSMELRYVRILGEVKPLGDTVKIPVQITSAMDSDTPMWVEAIPGPGDHLAKYLRQGDYIGVTGFPTFQRWGADDPRGAKVSCTLRFAKVHYSNELRSAIFDRGGDTLTAMFDRDRELKGKRNTKTSVGNGLTDDLPF